MCSSLIIVFTNLALVSLFLSYIAFTDLTPVFPNLCTLSNLAPNSQNLDGAFFELAPVYLNFFKVFTNLEPVFANLIPV
jgi:hypothetical protein